MINWSLETNSPEAQRGQTVLADSHVPPHPITNNTLYNNNQAPISHSSQSPYSTHNPVSNTSSFPLTSLGNWNVNGLNDGKKREDILTLIHQHKLDFCMLQETHLDEKGLALLESKWFGQVHGTSFSSSSGGLATLIT
jgi:hypothetical protein